MSTDINGKKCACCGAYLFDEDDVVFCPVCGAPHHRDCYNSKGHCAFESLHGTDRQYDKVQKETAEKEQPNTQSAEQNTNNANDFNNAGPMPFLQFDMLGGIAKDFDLGDGVTANDAARFVLTNTHRYIPKFAAAKYGKKASFNWLAFLLPPAWFLSRKMYKIGIFVLVLAVSLTLLTFPFMLDFQNYLNADDPYNYSVIAKIFRENIGNFEKSAMITFFAATLGNILLSFFCGIFGDYLYRNHTLSSIKEIKKECLNYEDNMRKKGGVNLFAAMIALFVVEYLPSIIYGFIA